MSITLSVSDMTCEGCEDIVENAATEVGGVDSASADRHDGTVVVEGDAAAGVVIAAIDYAGYESTEVETAPENGYDESENGQSTESTTDAEPEDTGVDADELETDDPEDADGGEEGEERGEGEVSDETEETTESADDTGTDVANEADNADDADEADAEDDEE